MKNVDVDVRSDVARLLTHRCNNCYSELPGAVGCSVHSPGWNWVTPNFGPFCDECFKEVSAGASAGAVAPLDRCVQLLQAIAADKSAYQWHTAIANVLADIKRKADGR